MVGFGAAAIANPALVHILPLRFIVPLSSLQDFVAALALGRGFAPKVVWREYFWIAVPMLFGMALGLALLIRLPERAAMALLGVVVFANGLYGLVGRAATKPLHHAWALVIGLGGGVLSGMFGFGGPLYVIYLARRIPDMTALRATMATVLFTSSCTRLTLMAISGLLAQENLWLAVVWFLPFVFAGLFVGSRLHFKLPAERVRGVLNAVLVAVGLSLVVRAL